MGSIIDALSGFSIRSVTFSQEDSHATLSTTKGDYRKISLYFAGGDVSW